MVERMEFLMVGLMAAKRDVSLAVLRVEKTELKKAVL